MARDRDSDASGIGQSKRPPLNHHESTNSQMSDHQQQQQQQTHQQTSTQQQVQPHTQAHHHPRPKAPKHVVGGGRLHARVPSSKGLHKHHASNSTSKLNRRQASPSPERGPTITTAHRRATSQDLQLTHLKKNLSHTSLKRNRSHVEVGKKTKSSTNLKRTSSNPAVHKLKSSSGSNKVHFNLGHDEDDDGDENEWVDASTSASPLLSRRGSTVGAGQTTANHINSPSVAASMSMDNSPRASSPVSSQHPEPAIRPNPPPTNGNGANGTGASHSLGREQHHHPHITDHKQYLTSRILQRTPSQGAPPKMSAENASVRLELSRHPSPDTASTSGTPGRGLGQGGNSGRPGSSGKDELTSRFMGNHSQEPGSGLAGDSFLATANHGGLFRAANGNGTAVVTAAGGYLASESAPAPPAQQPPSRRPRSFGNPRADEDYEQQGQKRLDDSNLTDEEDADNSGLAGGANARRRGGYAIRDLNRTQQKLNLQRASSSLETGAPPVAHTHHPSVGGLAGMVPPAAPGGPLAPSGGPGLYDLSTSQRENPWLAKVLERTGMEYLVVRRYQNPVARSLSRLAVLTGNQIGGDKSGSKGLPSRPGTAYSTRRGTGLSETASLGGGRSSATFSNRDREGIQTLLDAQTGGPGHTRAASALPPPTTSGGTSRRAPFSGLRVSSVSSSLEAEHDPDGVGMAGRLQREQQRQQYHNGVGGHQQRLSGSSLMEHQLPGETDAETVALLRNLWTKNMDLSASQE